MVDRPPFDRDDDAPLHDGEPFVEGRLVSEHGEPAGGVDVRLYELGFGGKARLLAEATADERGFYRLAYDAGARAPRVEIRAVGPRGREVPISATAFGLARDEAIDLIVPAAVRPALPEFERLRADVAAQLGTLDLLAEAREDEGQRDLTLLRASTGWDARLLALAARAVALSRETGIAEDALYAAARAGLPTDAAGLSAVSAPTFGAALRKAQSADIVGLGKDEQAVALEAFEHFVAGARLERRAPGTVSSLGELLSTAGASTRQRLTPEEQATFARVIAAVGGGSGDLWQAAVKAGIDEAKVAGLRTQGKLAYLTLNNAPLAASVQRDARGAKDLSWLVERDFDRSATWKARLEELTPGGGAALEALIPEAYAGETVADRLEAYADDLAAKVRESFPTQVVARMVTRDELTLDATKAEKARVGSFLRQAGSLGFELGRVPLGAFLDDHREQLFATPEEEAAAAGTLQQVGRLTRLYQITPTDRALGTLAANGFDSARDVVAFTPEAFVEHYGSAFASREEAELTYAKAQQVHAVTQNVVAMAAGLSGTPHTQVTASSAQAVQAAQGNLIKRFPTMESLFGSLDFCACEHCGSVLSPAAYLVDLLAFLDPDTNVWSAFKTKWKATHGQAAYPHGTPYDALTARRPDLPYLPLTCENTHTALPYIDVVNEILEYFIAKGGLDTSAAYDTGAATTPELLAEPQNILAAAYEHVRDARYPLRLPFDLWLETVRRFAECFETPLWQVLETFRPNDQLFPPTTGATRYYREAVFVESLGISPAEHAIFTEANPLQAWFGLYGYDTEAAALTVATDADGQRVDLHSAKALSRRLGVSYRDLVALVGTSFVNPRMDRLVTLHKLGIEVHDVFRYMQHAAYPPFTPAERTAFEARLDALTARYNPSGDPQGFDARAWITAAWPAGFSGILVLADPQSGCDFDKTTLRYADGAAADPLVFVKLNLLVRLWRRLGWTIEETDRALGAFVPRDSLPLTAATIGPALRTALVYVAHLAELDRQVKVGKDSRLKLLTIWSDIATTGKDPLYERLFITPTVLRNSPVFDDPLGNYLSQPAVLLKDHLLAVQGAVNLTAAEVALVLADAQIDPDTAPLSLPIVSLLYRHGLLARALKTPVRDLLALKQLSGLDPCSRLAAAPLAQLDDDYPFARTLRFVEIARRMKASGFADEDLDYLFRHRFDPAGKYRFAADLPASLIRSLAVGLRRIEADHATPADPLLITDDFLREKLALVFTPDVVNEFFGYWTDSAEFTARKAGVVPAKKLDPVRYEVLGLRAAYDATRNRQQLTHVGVLSGARKATILQALPAPAAAAPQDERDAYAVFTELLDAIAAESQPRPRAFFDKYFGGIVAYDDLYGTALAPPTQARRRAVAGAILPFVRQKLAQALVVGSVAAELGADLSLIEGLVTDASLLADPGSTAQQRPPLLDGFVRLGTAGATADFFASADLSGARLAASGTGAHVAVAAGSGAGSARFRGHFEVSEAGAYRFFARFGNAAARANLTVGVQPPRTMAFTPTAAQLEVSGPDDFLELEPGVLYEFTVEARTLQAGAFELLIQGETLPKDGLGQLALYPSAVVDRVREALALLDKTLRLVTGLELTERELRYFLTHAADFDGLDLAKLPVQRLGDTAADAARATALFTQFLRLVGYAELKRGPGGGTDDLVGVFERARATYETTDSEAAKTLHFEPLAQLLRRDAASVRATAEGLGFRVAATTAGSSRRIEAPDLASEHGVRRLWDALQIVETLGVPVDTVIDATGIVAAGASASARFDIARDFRNAVKARYDMETWQRTAQPIFDRLRRSQRDALVAYVMHDRGFERIEQLFEYFLIDPGMEPVVQTSRLRLAISSVQLFVQRCLLNLEPDVHPTAIINSDHWQWMKRYRVWEANRKIFLFPENWLEPEFRDDKTHLFKALEGELFQDDITNDLAEAAFLGYLTKLDELARLDIVAMHVEERSDPRANVLHVIGRTFNLPHKYFHRRYAHGMWTPWEPIAADIEGDHVAVTLWRNRLHVFWLTLLDKPAMENNPSAELTMSDGMKVQKAVQRQVEIQLNWCEQLEGEWATRSSSGFANPIRTTVPASFDGSDGTIHTTTNFNADGSEGSLDVHLGGSFTTHGLGNLARVALVTAYRLESKNAPPRKEHGEPRKHPPYVTLTGATQPTRYDGVGSLQVVLTDRMSAGPPLKKEILRKGRSAARPGFSLLPSNGALDWETTRDASLNSPFFYVDDHHSFFVEPKATRVPVKDYEKFGVEVVDVLHLADDELWKDLPIVVEFPELPERIPIPNDPRAKYTVRPRGDWLTGDRTIVRFGDGLIGRDGLAPEASAPREVVADLADDDLDTTGPGRVMVVDARGVHPRLMADVIGRGIGRDVPPGGGRP